MPGVGASRCESWQLLFVLFVCVPPARRGRRNIFLGQLFPVIQFQYKEIQKDGKHWKSY